MGPLVGVSILCILSSLAFILLKKKMLVALLCVVAVYVLCLFLVEPWVGLQLVIVEFPGHIHLLLTLQYTGDISTQTQICWLSLLLFSRDILYN